MLKLFKDFLFEETEVPVLTEQLGAVDTAKVDEEGVKEEQLSAGAVSSDGIWDDLPASADKNTPVAVVDTISPELKTAEKPLILDITGERTPAVEDQGLDQPSLADAGASSTDAITLDDILATQDTAPAAETAPVVPEAPTPPVVEETPEAPVPKITAAPAVETTSAPEKAAPFPTVEEIEADKAKALEKIAASEHAIEIFNKEYEEAAAKAKEAIAQIEADLQKQAERRDTDVKESQAFIERIRAEVIPELERQEVMLDKLAKDEEELKREREQVIESRENTAQALSASGPSDKNKVSNNPFESAGRQAF
jgi:hypothetical protein